MEIKNVYTEANPPKETVDFVEDYGPYFALDADSNAFFLAQEENKRYALRFQKTEEEVKSEFLSKLKRKKDVDKKFYATAEETVQVKRVYLPVEYITVTAYEKSSMKNKHYATTGYTVTSHIDGNQATTTSTPHYTYTHSSYSTVTKNHRANDTLYYCYWEETLTEFSDHPYDTSDKEANDLVTAEELKNVPMFPYSLPYSHRHPEYGTVKSYERHQILLFPFWIIEVSYNGRIYYNYASDCASSRPIYYKHSEENLFQLQTDLEIANDAYNRAAGVAGVLSVVSFIFAAITLIIHFFSSVAMMECKGYAGFLYQTLGKLGIVLNIIGGVSIVGYILIGIGFGKHFGSDDLHSTQTLRSPIKIKNRLEKLNAQTPKTKSSYFYFVFGALFAVAETTLFFYSLLSQVLV